MLHRFQNPQQEAPLSSAVSVESSRVKKRKRRSDTAISPERIQSPSYSLISQVEPHGGASSPVLKPSKAPKRSTLRMQQHEQALKVDVDDLQRSLRFLNGTIQHAVRSFCQSLVRQDENLQILLLRTMWLEQANDADAGADRWIRTGVPKERFT